MEKKWVNNKCPEGYSGLKAFYIAGKIPKVYGDVTDHELLNGVEVKLNDVPEFPRTKYKGTYILWNRGDQALYIVSRFIGGLDEKAATSLAHSIIDSWPVGKFDIKTEKLPGVFVKFPGEKDVIPSLIPMLPPKGHNYLGEVFTTPALQTMYEEFMLDPFIYKRFLTMCKVNNIPVKPEMDRSAALPIHKIDVDTGELLISDRVLKVFNQYQFSRNYLDGFDLNTPEHDLGKMMRLDQKFCEYMMNRANNALSGKELNPETYSIELDAAIKRIEGNKELMDLYINDLES